GQGGVAVVAGNPKPPLGVWPAQLLEEVRLVALHRKAAVLDRTQVLGVDAFEILAEERRLHLPLHAPREVGPIAVQEFYQGDPGIARELAHAHGSRRPAGLDEMP